MQIPDGIRILFVAGFGPIVRSSETSRTLYEDVLGIRFKQESGDYLHTESLEGVKSFALWPLSQAARSCFGTESWPDELSIPQAWLEFDVDDVEETTRVLQERGYRMLVKNKKEPWGQTVSRFLSPEGLLIGVSLTPFLRDAK
jgi:catechol 2,3-dioxygenase-like lactoylglutathione lyase family enzyme